ncbi:MAG: hypothetical protein ACT4PM_07090 [Gemmatimonadales bacterium]
MSAFGVAALVIVLLLFTLSLAVAGAQERLVARLRSRVAQMKRWGGVILVIVGLWLIGLTVFADFFAGIFPV